jgi:hypothetical protein
MRKRLAFILALLVLVPAAGLILLGLAVARHEQRQVGEQFRQVLESRLADLGLVARRVAREHERGLLRKLAAIPDDAEPEFYRAAVRRDRLVRQFVVYDAEGGMRYPAGETGLTQQERDFLDRTRSIRNGHAALRLPTDDSGSPPPEHGWQTWFWGDGLRLILWLRRPDGVVVGAEADPATLIGDIIAGLPATAHGPAPESNRYRIALRDAQQRTIYQWGTWTPPAAQAPAAHHALDPPLGAWSLVAFSP